MARGLRAKRRFCSSVNGLSERGRIHCGVRWKTWTDRAPLASSGTICAALAPVPMTATRRSARSCSCSQRAEWKQGPAKVARPSRSGTDGVVKVPMAETRTSASQVAPVGVGEPPAPCAGIPRRRRDARVRPQVRADAEAVGAVLEVAEDLGLVGVRLGPVGLQGEGVGVEVRRHVAGGAGVGVRPPGAADAVGRLEDHEITPPGLDQLHGQSEAARPRPDDGDLPVRHRARRAATRGRLAVARCHRRVCIFATGPPGEGDPRPRVWHRGPGTVWPERRGRGGT